MNGPSAVAWLAVGAWSLLILFVTFIAVWTKCCQLIEDSTAHIDAEQDELYDQDLDAEPFASWERQFEVTS